MKLRWGILGTGAIAGAYAKGVTACDNGTIVAVGSRDYERAKEFTDKNGGKPYGSYDDVLADPEVDAVYIALPHHMHADSTIACAKAGKHILCEKPFTLNLADAERALEAVKAADVFFMEAWMYRSHPQTLKVKQLLAEGAIGTPRMVIANFGYFTDREREHFKLDQGVGGGGLMDVGSYPVSFSRMVAGQEPTRCEYICDFYRGYDGHGAGLLEFGNGLRANFATGVHVNLDNSATIYGETARIHLPSPWFCGGPIHLSRPGKSEPEVVEFDKVADLWGNQAGIVAKYLDRRQSPTMSWEDTLGNMRTLDALRKSAGLVFGEEQA